MSEKNNALFWKKKEFLSFLLSILIFFIHSYFAPQIVSDQFISTLNHKVSYFLSCSITRFAVPMFFIMSGIAFFKDYSNKKYLSKIKNRLFTLVIPYLLWNTIWMLWEIFTSYSFLAKFSQDSAPFPLTLTNILKGVFFYGCNVPFWFVFDLIVFSLLAPLVFLIIKNKYVGIISVIALSVVSLFGVHLPEKVFYYPMAIVFYLIGAIIGHHFFDFAAKKSSNRVQVVSGVVLAAYIILKNVAPTEIHIDNFLTQTIVYTLAAVCLWNLSDSFIEKIKPRAIYRRSFAVYAMHLPIAIVMLKVLSLFAPQNEWLEIPKFVIMVVSTLVIINLVCAFLEKFTPRISATLMGNRIHKK